MRGLIVYIACRNSREGTRGSPPVARVREYISSKAHGQCGVGGYRGPLERACTCWIRRGGAHAVTEVQRGLSVWNLASEAGSLRFIDPANRPSLSVKTFCLSPLVQSKSIFRRDNIYNVSRLVSFL